MLSAVSSPSSVVGPQASCPAPCRPEGRRRPVRGGRGRWLGFALAATLACLPLDAAAQMAPAAGEARTLDLEMYWSLQSVGSPQISPDGRQVIYTRGWIDRTNDRRRSEIWIMNADGSRKRALGEGSSPAWSPDGTRIAFLASGDPGGNQIHVRWMDDEGATSQITRLEKSPSNLRWSPDGAHLAFTMDVDARNNWSIDMPARPEGATWTPGPKIVERASYRRDRQGYVDDSYSHLFIVSADGGAVRQLTNGDWNHGSGEWTADGSELVFTSLRVEDADLQWRHSELYAVAWRTGVSGSSRAAGARTPEGSPPPTAGALPGWATTGTPTPTATASCTS
jgi:dipeptidyl aminopeptidase/acylaminoacyl peptidase